MSPRAVTLALLLAACSGRDPPPGEKTGAAAFPALPTTPAAVERLIADETRRPPPAIDPDLDAAAILAAIDARGAGALPSGTRAITRWIQAAIDAQPGDLYLLFGTWHDAPGQVDAFRRLIGPGGLRGLHLVAAEQLRADGAWRSAPSDAQRGDGALLDRWSTRGDATAFSALADRHRDGDYAAWKLGYEPTVLDLLVSARAANLRVVGCDMPAKLQALSGAEGEARHRLREIHCLRSLPTLQPRRAALLWGDAHVKRSGLPRFLPAGAGVIVLHAFGQRQSAGAVESALAARIRLVDPLLVPVTDRELVLLLPDETLGVRVDRVLTAARDHDPGAPFTGIIASAEIDGALRVGDRTLSIGRDPQEIPLPPGDHTYAFTTRGRTLVGAARLAAGHRVELSFDEELKLVGYVERAAR